MYDSEDFKGATADFEDDDMSSIEREYELARKRFGSSNVELFQVFDRQIQIAERDTTRDQMRMIATGMLKLKRMSITKTRIGNAIEAMDKSHQGQDALKHFLICQLLHAMRTGEAPSPILLVGEPGCGKTSLALSLAKGLGCGWYKISLSGVTGSFVLNGNDVGYKDCKCGKILEAFISSGSRNPVIIFDEVDKAGESQQNGRTADALLDVLDCDQAKHFRDNFINFPFDISSAWYILTANSLATVPQPLLDRCIVYNVPPYSFFEKKEIICRIIEENNRKIAPCSISFSPDQIDEIVLTDGTSGGVRNAKRLIERFFSYLDSKLDGAGDGKLEVSSSDFSTILAPQNTGILNEAFKECGKSGVVNGLAVMNNTGFVMPVEAIASPFFQGLSITGNIDEDMGESAQIALLAARSLLTSIGREIPEGGTAIHYPHSVRKGGGSAGVATCMAILSSLLSIPVPSEYAMTGAISLTGAVLAIGNAPVKIRGARDAGITHVIVPSANKKDVLPLPMSLFKGITIHFVSDLEEVAKLLFPTIFREGDTMKKKVGNER